MKLAIINTVAAALIFAVMDSIWFAVFMKKFSIDKIGHLMNLSNGKLSPDYISVLMAYIMMIAIAVFFLAPKIESLDSVVMSVAYGFLMGVCLFGVFDFTNSALMKNYPLVFTLADTFWGGVMYAVLGAIFYLLKVSLIKLS